MSAEGAINPKSVYEILANASKRDHRGASLIFTKETNMLKAYSKKYRDRNVLVNKTPFSFDSDGYCSEPEIGSAKTDFEQLLKMAHIDEVLDEPEIPEEDAHEDGQEVIDAPPPAEIEDEDLDEDLDEEEEDEEEDTEEDSSEPTDQSVL